MTDNDQDAATSSGLSFTNVFIVPMIFSLQSGHLLTLTAQLTQHIKCLHGRKSVPTCSSKQTLHCNRDRNRSTSLSFSFISSWTVFFFSGFFFDFNFLDFASFGWVFSEFDALMPSSKSKSFSRMASVLTCLPTSNE